MYAESPAGTCCAAVKLLSLELFLQRKGSFSLPAITAGGDGCVRQIPGFVFSDVNFRRMFAIIVGRYKVDAFHALWYHNFQQHEHMAAQAAIVKRRKL